MDDTKPTTTDDALLRTLATACGYRCEPGAWATIEGFIITASDGEPIGFGVTEDAAWNNAEDHMPDWRYSTEAALYKLPWPDGWRLDMDVCAKHADVWLHNVSPVLRAQAPTLARALCEVFAAWWNATHEEER